MHIIIYTQNDFRINTGFETIFCLFEYIFYTTLGVKKTEYKEKGKNLTPSQLETRNIMTVNGLVSVSRRRLRPISKEDKALLWNTDGVKSIAPLDCFSSERKK